MRGRYAELVRRGMSALARSGFWWGFAAVTFVLLNLAFSTQAAYAAPRRQKNPAIPMLRS